MDEKIEDKVKKIVETSSMLSIREKSDIICLIECYKNTDKQIQEYIKKIDGTITALDNLRRLVNNEFDYDPSPSDIIGDLTATIKYLKKGLL